MAYTSGTATNYLDLLSILSTFVSSHGWTVLEQSTTRLQLRGEGISALDEIYVGIDAFSSIPSGYYNWTIAGAWGWRTGRTLLNQPMSSSARYVYLWNSSIPYWIVADAEHIIMIAKVGTTYQTMYLGFGTRCATEAQYPYPLIIGGCGAIAAQAYSVTGTGNSAFWSNLGRNGVICRPGGDWDKLGLQQAVTVTGDTDYDYVYCPPITQDYDNISTYLKTIDGSYLLDEIWIRDALRKSIYSKFKGLFRVTGYQNSAENIITVSGLSYLVVPDVYRSTTSDYCAILLN